MNIIYEDNKAYFNGNTYYLTNTGYYQYPHHSLHVDVWEYHNPNKSRVGYEVHHKDFDKNNNDISNLKLITIKSHRRIHYKYCNKELFNKFIVAGREYSKTKEAKEIRSKNIMESLQKREYKTYTCDCCGKIFKSRKLGYEKGLHFCNTNCNSKYHYQLKEHHETRICIICGKHFSVYKYRKTKTCSNLCTNRLIGQNKKIKNLISKSV